MLSRIRSQLPSWRRALRRRRRTLTLLTAALLVAVLLPTLLPALVPSAVATTTVVLASTELPIGTEIEESHLETVQVAEDLAPPGLAASPEQLTGRRTVAAVPEGTPVLPGMLEGESSGAVAQGSALMAISTPVVLSAHLQAGASIEILSSTPEAGTTRRTRAQVVEVTAPPDGAASGLTPTPTGEAMVLITVDHAGARDLAHAIHEGWMTITVIG